MTGPIDSTMSEPQPTLQWAYRVILVLALVVLGLIAALIILWIRRPMADADLAALEDPEIRRQIVARLANENVGFNDSHVDADVGRITASMLVDFEVHGVTLSTNRFGMRERDYSMPKSEGTVRIVLLGDSFVFGLGVAADERMGVYLEEALRQRSSYEGKIEVLHLGVSSWNFINEAAFLRRQLSDLQPDVVLNFSLPNDIEDAAGTRGNGLLARFSPQLPERADSVLDAGFPMLDLGFKKAGYVRHGIDYEGRQRYAESVEVLSHLNDVIEAAGGHYRLFIHFRHLLRPAWKHLGRYMPEGTTYYIGKKFGNDKTFWVGETNHHWNAAGHFRVSRMLYEVLRKEDLVPELGLPEWDEAQQEFLEIVEAGLEDAGPPEQDDHEILASLWSPPVVSSIDFRQLNDALAAQIHTGIDRERLVSPYASFVLANEGAMYLEVRGRALQRPEIDGAEVQVFIDGEQVGMLDIESGKEFDLKLPLSPSMAERPFVSVRFIADDYFYQGANFQHCVVFQLDSIALESGP